MLDAKQGKLAALVQEGFGQNVETINGVKKEIRELLHHVEVFWQQRSKSIWLPAEDKNTKNFLPNDKSKKKEEQYKEDAW